MKKINKSIISLLTLISLTVNSAFAAGFPSEPMVIYGSIEGSNIENRILKIYDGEESLLKTIDINNGKFGTNKTFDLEHKITLNEYNGELKFSIDDYVLEILDNNINDCNGDFSFKSGGLCELNFKDVNLSIDTLDDLDNIPEEEKSNEFDDVFVGKVVEVTQEEVKQNLGDNIVSGTSTSGSIVIVNKAVDVDAAVIKDIVLISDTQKELVFIPKDTNTGNNDLVIQKPLKITSTLFIQSKINKDIFGSIEIPTNNQVNFDKDIRVCLETNINSISGLKVYASHDNNSWFLDPSAKNLKIQNSQICFDVNHLTSFVVTKDIPTKSSSSGGGYSRPDCKQSQLTCTKVGVKYYMRAIDESKCKVIDVIDECGIDSITQLDVSKTLNSVVLNNNETVTKISGNKVEYKLTSKKYITGVRTFIANKREVKQKYGLQVSYMKSDNEYNKTIDMLLKDINNNMNIQSIKQDMVKHIDTMTTSYGVTHDETVGDDLRKTFKAKLKNDILRVQNKLKVLKRKDYIVNKALKERALRRVNSSK